MNQNEKILCDTIRQRLQDLSDPYILDKWRRLQEAMGLMPMRVVLGEIAGKNIAVKAKLVGVSRNTWYAWQRGEIRPNKKQADRISELIGVPADKFRGRR